MQGLFCVIWFIAFCPLSSSLCATGEDFSLAIISGHEGGGIRSMASDLWFSSDTSGTMKMINDDILSGSDSCVSSYGVYSVTDQMNVTKTVQTTARWADVFLVAGGLETVLSVAIVAKLESIATISLVPIHKLPTVEGYSSNLLVPWIGQSFKGQAAVDVISQGSSSQSLEVLIIRDDKKSPELVEFERQAAYDSAEFHLRDLMLSDSTAQLSDIVYATNEKVDAVIIDCSLHSIHAISSALQEALVEATAVIFLHDFAELSVWEGLDQVSGIVPYVLAFHQRLPSDTVTSIYDVVLRDSILALGLTIDAVAASRDCGNVSSSSSCASHSQLVTELKAACIDDFTAKLGFASGNLLPLKCLNSAIVSFDVVRLKKCSGSQTEWELFGSWSRKNDSQSAVYLTEKLWKSTPIRQQPGRTLYLSLIPFPPFSYWNHQRRQYEGVDIDLIQNISRDPELNITDVHITGYDGDWTTMVEAVDTGVYDMAMGALPRSTGSENSLFTRFYFTSGLSILVRVVPDSLVYMFRFMSPFHWSVWMAFLGVIAASSVVCRLLDLTTTYADGVWLSISALFYLQENRLVQMTNPFGRVFMISLCFAVLVLISAYTANMVSFLTPMSDTVPISGFSSLKYFKVGVLDYDPHYKLLALSAGVTDIVRVAYGDNIAELLRNGTFDAFVSDTPFIEQLTRMAGPDCDLGVVDGEAFKQQYAFAISPSLHKSIGEEINLAITSAVVSGSVLQSYYYHLLHNATCSSNIQDSTNRRMDEALAMENISGVFIIGAIASALCLVLKGLHVWVRSRSSQIRVGCISRD